jgi:hypothetical protein
MKLTLNVLAIGFVDWVPLSNKTMIYFNDVNFAVNNYNVGFTVPILLFKSCAFSLLRFNDKQFNLQQQSKTHTFGSLRYLYD